MMGRRKKNVFTDDLRSKTVNIEDLDKGIYVISIRGNIRKLVVE